MEYFNGLRDTDPNLQQQIATAWGDRGAPIPENIYQFVNEVDPGLKATIEPVHADLQFNAAMYVVDANDRGRVSLTEVQNFAGQNELASGPVSGDVGISLAVDWFSGQTAANVAALNNGNQD